MVKELEVYIIRHKETKEQWVASSGKAFWKKPGYAKSAWANHIKEQPVKSAEILESLGIIPVTSERWGRDYVENYKFDDQDVYEIVKLETKSSKLFGEMVCFIEAVADRCHDGSFRETAKEILWEIKNDIYGRTI